MTTGNLTSREVKTLPDNLINPRLGFLGVGWIGRNRMEAISLSNLSEISCIADPSSDCLAEASNIAPGAKLFSSFDELLSEEDLDGVVIATPSALHAEQSLSALTKGLPVFCQKPLGRNFYETKSVVDCARRVNRLLGIDLSYRYTTAFENVFNVIRSGDIGNIFSIDLVFHNSSGPGKQWFYDMKLSGGGCIIDLGIHLIDLALYALDFPEVKKVSSRIYSNGNLISGTSAIVEDYASAVIELENDVTIQLNCSWNLSSGKDAVIEASFHGTTGGVTLRNINGSYYDFNAELYRGTKTQILCTPPDTWGGRAAVEWVNKLLISNEFSEEAEQYVKVASVLDKIYGRI